MKQEAENKGKWPSFAAELWFRFNNRAPFTARLLLNIKSRASKRRILYSTVTEFLHNDLLTSAAAIAYFGMLVLFPALLLLSVYYSEALLLVRPFFPGSYEFVRRNLGAMQDVSGSILFASFTVLLWAGSWIFTIIERTTCRILENRTTTVFTRPLADRGNDGRHRSIVAGVVFANFRVGCDSVRG